MGFSRLIVLALLAVTMTLASMDGASALSCSATWECTSVSNNYNYVECVDGTCACRSALGFSGTATTGCKCACVHPNNVYWEGGNPYCIQYDNAVAYLADREHADVLVAKVNAVYASTVWPAPAQIIFDLVTGNSDQGLMGTLFTDTTRGRVDPVGEFVGYSGAVEYFYGTIWFGQTKIVDYNMKHVMAEGNKAASRVDLFVESYLAPDFTTLAFVTNITQTGIWTFDENDRVESVELIIHNNGWNSNPNFLDTPENRAGLCYTILVAAGCNSTFDSEGYYDDFNDCLAFVNTLEFGTWDMMRSNTVICRVYHAILSMVEPQMHCSHAGKTGGGKCTDHAYADYYLTDY